MKPFHPKFQNSRWNLVFLQLKWPQKPLLTTGKCFFMLKSEKKGPNFWGTLLPILRLTFLESFCNFRKCCFKKNDGYFFFDWMGLLDPCVVTLPPFARWICFQMAMSWWPSWCCNPGACSPGGYVPGRTSSHGSWNVKGLPFQQNDKWKHLLCAESSKLIMVNLKDLVAEP